MSERRKYPNFWLALRLKCPYCGITPLRKSSSWLAFREGCTDCDYRFEREEGYFGGASQIISFFVIGLLAFAAGGLLLWLSPKTDGLVIAAVVSAFIVFVGIGFFPFGMALWIYLDHRLHPLTDYDRLQLPVPKISRM